MIRRRLFVVVESCRRLMPRLISTEAFVSSVEKVQHQLSISERKQDLLLHGRQLFESETLDDVHAAWSPVVAGKICHAATQLRISPTKGQPFGAVVGLSLTADAVRAMDAPSLARIAHSCLILRSPHLYEVLFTYIRKLIELAPTLDTVSCAVLINAYGRAQVHHDEFYRIICNRAAVVMKDPRTFIAHTANVAHALARVKYFHRELFLVLRDQAERQASQGPPLVAVTILDGFAEVGFVDDALFTALEKRLLGELQELPGPLMASLVSCLAKAGRTPSPLFTACGERIVAVGNTFDSNSIAKTCDAFYRANLLAEEVLGTLAERACKVVADFRVDEINLTLRALASFDLFDGELFPLLASRFVSIVKQGGYVSPVDAAGTLASFAAVQEKSDELVHVCMRLLASHRDALDGMTLLQALWACATLNVRSEAQQSLLQCLSSGSVMLPDPADAERQSKLVLEQLHMVKKELSVYCFTVPLVVVFAFKGRISGLLGRITFKVIMYRESLLGVALGATLVDLESVCHLTEEQKEKLWEIFDVAMDRALAESPVRSQVCVRTSAPSRGGRVIADSAAEGGSGCLPSISTEVTTTKLPLQSSRAATATAAVPCDVVEEVVYPVYRVKDGLWTILLKDPSLELTDATGFTETIQLDYLKVYLKEVVSNGAAQPLVSSGRKRRRQ